MATLGEIRASKEEVKEKIMEMAKKNPNKGAYEFTEASLRIMGKGDVKVKSPEDFKYAISGLSRAEKNQLKSGLEEYSSAQEQAMKELQSGGSIEKIVKLPGKLISTVAKGAGIGVGVAGVTNTVAPGLFSTAAGFISANAPALSAKLGIAAAGIFATPAISSTAILGAGAVLGATIYTIGKGAVAIGKAIHTHAKKKEEMDR